MGMTMKTQSKRKSYTTVTDLLMFW